MVRQVRQFAKSTPLKSTRNTSHRHQYREGGFVVVPHVRHLTPAQRMAGLEMGQFGRVEWPVWGNRAAEPRLSRKLDDPAEANIAASATGRKVRIPVICLDRIQGLLSGNLNAQTYDRTEGAKQ